MSKSTLDMFKYYALYRIETNALVDVISEKDIGLAAKWFVDKGYNNNHTVRCISIKTLKTLKARLRKQKRAICSRIANISRYV